MTSGRPVLRVVAVAFGLTLSAGLWLLLRYNVAEVPAFLRSSGSVRVHDPDVGRQSSTTLSMAGSGTNLPLLRILVASYQKRYPGRRVRVHDSIGSSGGVKAICDGVVDVGLVSRPLRRRERRLGIRLMPYARVAVVLAVHPSVRIRDLTRQTLLALYRGQRSFWRSQLPVVVLQRERGDSGHLAITRHIPAFREANEDAYQRHRWQIFYRDLAIQAALLSQPGAVGVFDYGAITSQRLPLVALSFEGHKPSVASLASGRYPFEKTLSFVLKSDRFARAQHFFSFLATKESRALILRAGYLPIPLPLKGGLR